MNPRGTTRLNTRRNTRGLLQLGLVALALRVFGLSVLGCAADGAESPDVGTIDQGALDDGGFIDVGLDGSVAAATLLPADPARFASFLAAAAGTFTPAFDALPAPWTRCFDTATRCSTEPCAQLATCCVASDDCADLQVDALLPATLLFASCATGASALTCVPDQTLLPLGMSTPTVEAGGLRPGGSGSAEGGVLVGAPLDARVERLSLTVVFAPPLSCPNSTCLESAAVSLAPSAELALGVVNPLAGLLYSASRGDVSLVLGGQVRAAWALSDPNASFTLELLPSGRVRVYRDGELLSDTLTYAPAGAAQVVLHGRNTALQGARVRSLHALRYRSEAPARFDPTRTLIALPGPLDVAPWAPRAASVTSHAGRSYVVVENAGALYRGELVGQSVSFDSTQRVVVAPSLGEEALSAPTLLVRESGETLLVYAATQADGTRVIRARRGVDGPLGALPEVLSVADAGPGHSLDDPSVLEHAGRYILLARHVWPDGGSELGAWVSPASPAPSLRDLSPAPASNLGALTSVASSRAAQTEVRAPSLSVRGGSYRVHYERRTGTRSVVELLVSDELRAFRAVGEVLGPRPGEVDALGVGSPSALQDPAGTERLFTMARSGVNEALTVSERVGVLDPAALGSP